MSRLEAVQQLAAAVILLSAGYERLAATSGGQPILPAALIAAGVVLLVTAARALRGRTPWHPGLLNIVAGVALLTEWGVDLAADGGKIIRPSLLMAFVSLGLGVFHHRIQRARTNRRILRLDADGLSFRLNPIRKFKVRWEEVASIAVHPTEILFRRRSGGDHRIPLARLDNAREVVDAVLSASHAAGIASSTGVPALT